MRMIALVRVEAVHLDEELVERLLALVVAAAEAGAALAADGVDLVDEDDAGGVLLALLEEVADARGAHADEHLDEVRAADGEEGDVGLAGDGPGQQGLARARARPTRRTPLGMRPPSFWNFWGSLRNSMISLELLLGLVDAGDVLERHLLGQPGEQLGPALAEGHGLVPSGLHLPHEKDPEEDEEDDREPAEEEGEPAVLGRVLDDDVDLVLAEDLDQFVVLGRAGRS